MKHYAWYFLAIYVAFLGACATFKENPVMASIAVSQSTARLIQASGDPKARAQRADKVLALAEGYVLETSGATFQGVVVLIGESIDYTKLTKADELLINDLLEILGLELQNLTKKKIELQESEIILILIRKARTTAQAYL